MLEAVVFLSLSGRNGRSLVLSKKVNRKLNMSYNSTQCKFVFSENNLRHANEGLVSPPLGKLSQPMPALNGAKRPAECCLFPNGTASIIGSCTQKPGDTSWGGFPAFFAALIHLSLMLYLFNRQDDIDGRPLIYLTFY